MTTVERGVSLLPNSGTLEEEELHGPDEPVYTIGVAARLLGVTPQQLRAFEREHLVEPARTDKNTRLYSKNDLLLLQRICELVRDRGVNAAGVRAILAMEAHHRVEICEIEKRISSSGGRDFGDDD